MKPLNWTTKLLNWTILKLIYWTLKLNNSIKSVFNFFTSSLWRLDLSIFFGRGGVLLTRPLLSVFCPPTVSQYMFLLFLYCSCFNTTTRDGKGRDWSWAENGTGNCRSWENLLVLKYACCRPFFFLSSLIKRYIFVVRTSSFNIFSIFIHFISVWM